MKTCLIVLSIVLIGAKVSFGNVKKNFHLITSNKENWYRALSHCIANGMRLASVLSEEENDEILKQIRDSGTGVDFWLSGTRLGNNDNYYWMGHNEALNFTNWSDGEPNNAFGHESCVHISYQNYKWNDLDCLFSAYFVCEEDSNEVHNIL
ncbi:hypothetical protein HA402_004885 [Bradysia odoriphaga]|nr:hypothetical protein HA402_004885 [Bradysia odoriphaga]